jgi:hypothetical protein
LSVDTKRFNTFNIFDLANFTAILENKGITDIAGKGVDRNATGSAAYSSFGQPVGIAVENDTNIYITDAKYGAIKLVTTISGTINFLIHLQKIYATVAFYLSYPEKEHLLYINISR